MWIDENGNKRYPCRWLDRTNLDKDGNPTPRCVPDDEHNNKDVGDDHMACCGQPQKRFLMKHCKECG